VPLDEVAAAESFGRAPGNWVPHPEDVPSSPVDRPLITPIVAVPGLGLSAAVPRCTLDSLAVPSAVVELPGFGLPAPRGTELGPDDLARLLLTRLDESGVARAVLLGHSASCQIVVQAAVRDPHRVTALVLVGPTTDPRARSWLGLAGRWLRTAAWERPGQAPRLVRDYRRTGLIAMGRGMNAARRDRIDRGLAQVGWTNTSNASLQWRSPAAAHAPEPAAAPSDKPSAHRPASLAPPS
jgi:pimeloyl-ACP methyl ester carboxylesterase